MNRMNTPMDDRRWGTMLAVRKLPDGSDQVADLPALGVVKPNAAGSESGAGLMPLLGQKVSMTSVLWSSIPA